MIRLSRRAVLAAALTGFAATAASAQQGAASPMDAVKAFYNSKIPDEARPYSQRLIRLRLAATRRSQQINEPVSGLDFDPTIDGQDADMAVLLRSLQYFDTTTDPIKPTIQVTFTQSRGAPPVTLTYTTINEGGWKVDDIAKLRQRSNWRWSTLLARGAKGQ